MFDINIKFNNITITSIQGQDVAKVKEWSQCQHIDLKYNIDFSDLYERFLEYYMSECEFFLKISKHDKLSGILKGRMEFKATNMVWISCFCVDENYIDIIEQKDMLLNVLDYFSKNFGIDSFLTGISSSEKKTMKVFKDANFKIDRVNKEFYSSYENKEDLLIFKKNN